MVVGPWCSPWKYAGLMRLLSAIVMSLRSVTCWSHNRHAFACTMRCFEINVDSPACSCWVLMMTSRITISWLNCSFGVHWFAIIRWIFKNINDSHRYVNLE